jgi:hypothetical protein
MDMDMVSCSIHFTIKIHPLAFRDRTRQTRWEDFGWILEIFKILRFGHFDDFQDLEIFQRFWNSIKFDDFGWVLDLLADRDPILGPRFFVKNQEFKKGWFSIAIS